MLVWQGDTPDSGEAAIMGVPLPHPVLPLSGCLSRRTPTRATRGEARGHRSALAQNSLLMYPLPLPPLDLSSVWCVLAIWWTGPACLRCCGCTLPGFARWRYFVDMWVAEGHTKHDDRGPGTQQVPMVVRPSWGQWSLRGCVCQSRSPNPHWLPQMVGEGWGDEGYDLLAFICGFVSLR